MGALWEAAKTSDAARANSESLEQQVNAVPLDLNNPNLGNLGTLGNPRVKNDVALVPQVAQDLSALGTCASGPLLPVEDAPGAIVSMVNQAEDYLDTWDGLKTTFNFIKRTFNSTLGGTQSQPSRGNSIPFLYMGPDVSNPPNQYNPSSP